jgi:hypothetical protein
MPRVVPSQIVATIDRLFPWAASQAEGERIPLGGTSSVQIAAVLDLVEQVPDELITLNAEDYSALRVCVVGLRQKVSRWLARGDDLFDHISGLPPLNPITLIRQCLIKCPDESPTPGTVDLAFLGDQDLRESIRLDISAADRDLANGEWKGATVLAGSAVEALLLWALQEHDKRQPGSVRTAVAALLGGKTLTRDPGADLEAQGWHLHEYVEVASHLHLIEAETATQTRQARNFRNLIHPGRAARLGQKCDRGTALCALAAVELLVRDLTP